MYSPAFGWNILNKSINHISSDVSSKVTVFLLTLCQDDLSINASRVVKSLLLSRLADNLTL